MSQRISYYRVSTQDQTIESQRHALGGSFDAEYSDVGVSGTVPAMERPAFGELFSYIRKGDVLHVYAIDRLGRDAIDVQATVRALLAKGVALEVHGLGRIAAGVGELILAVLAQVADMERQRIVERTSAGRERAKELIASTGRTQNGKTSLGRPEAANPQDVREWRTSTHASIAQTATHFAISTATVKRYCAEG
ncbi:recombinase family protein [Acidovorax sp. Root217]|uniref:recombinase family protein n=1 Tax=Acidovorax sp. Root217 TaxID=1736492 RepID=UPI0007107E15|nr:recombinase family protein [Acidovorax sp. Root217]